MGFLFITINPQVMTPAPVQSIEVVSYLTMRKTIGWLGMLLPFLLAFGNLFINEAGLFNNEVFVQQYAGYSYESQVSFKSSVSHYYYTTMGEIFTGTLYAVALFMICYTGHPKRPEDWGLSDNAMTNLAGLFAIGVALFPTTGSFPMKDNLRSFISTEGIGWVHYFFAASFFVVLSLMCILNFRRSKDPALFGKGDDDPFFLRCGITMLACLVLVPILAQVDPIQRFNPTFILEALALITFGLSWLRKGQSSFSYLPGRFRRRGNSFGQN
jgi:hypothetical protein